MSPTVSQAAGTTACGDWGNYVVENSMITDWNNCAGVATIDSTITGIVARMHPRVTSFVVDKQNVNLSSSDDGVLFNKDKSEILQYPLGSSLTTYSIPNSVTKLGDYAFESANKLQSISLPASLSTIGEWNFLSEPSLKKFVVASGNTHFYSDKSGALYNYDRTTLIHFPSGSNLSSYEIPATVETLEIGAFEWTKNLTTLTFAVGSNLKTISPFAFDGSSVTEINIPDHVDQIQSYALAYNQELATINVSAKNPTFTSIDGVLFTKDLTQILQYPAARASSSYAIPNSVTTIGGFAFTYTKYLKSIEMNSVTTLSEYSFYLNSSLTSLTLNDSMISIGESAFSDNYSLCEISYANSTITTTRPTLEGIALHCAPTNEVTLPSGIEMEQSSGYTVQYASDSNETCYNVTFRNKTNKVISIDATSLQVEEKSNGVFSKIGGPETSDWKYISILPGDENKSYMPCIPLKGDLRDRKDIRITGQILRTNPPKIVATKSKIPTGYTISPTTFTNLDYDSSKKMTTVSIMVSSTKSVAKPLALSISNLALKNGQVTNKLKYISPSVDKSTGIVSYLITVGKIKGDVRKNESLTISANLALVARTQVKISTTSELPPLKYLKIGGFDSSSILDTSPPESWKYDAKSKTTTMTVMVQTYTLENAVDLYVCHLTIKYHGANVKPISTPTHLVALGDLITQYVSIAKIPGDVRAKGDEISLSGAYSSMPCS